MIKVNVDRLFQFLDLSMVFLILDKHWISLYDINEDKKSHKYVIDNNNGVFKLENMTSFTQWKDGHPEKNKPCTNLEKNQGWDWASDNCNHKHLCTCEYY